MEITVEPRWTFRTRWTWMTPLPLPGNDTILEILITRLKQNESSVRDQLYFVFYNSAPLCNLNV